MCGECLFRPNLGYYYCIWDYAVWNDTDGSGCYIWDGNVDLGQTKISGSGACSMIKTPCGVTPATSMSPPPRTLSEVTATTITGIPTLASGAPPSPALLGPSDRIALGVGIGLGLPTVIVCLLAWWCYSRARHGRGQEPKPSPIPPHSPDAPVPAAPVSEYSSGGHQYAAAAAASELPVPSTGPSAMQVVPRAAEIQ